MRLILAVLIAACTIATAQAQTVVTPTTICGTSQEEFLASSARLKAKILVANDKAREAILKHVNTARAGKGLWAMHADRLMIGLIPHEGRVLVGIVMFEDHCVVPGSVIVSELPMWIGFMMDAGVTMDDFKPETDA